MALTPSNMLELGTPAPDFRLRDTNSNSYYSFNDLKGEKGTLVMFICNHCPFVHHVLDEVLKIVHDYRVQGLGVIAISSNDVEQYPQDGPDLMAEFAFKNKFGFPYLYDQSQEVAKAFDAACTPDFYLFDNVGKLVYRGQLDDSRPGNHIPLSGSDLRNAIDSVIYNRAIPSPQKPSIGCNIKWKKNKLKKVYGFRAMLILAETLGCKPKSFGNLRPTICQLNPSGNPNIPKSARCRHCPNGLWLA